MIIRSITETKADFAALVELAIQGEEIMITRYGKPIAMLEIYDQASDFYDSELPRSKKLGD